jgi:hypothetical protein
MMQSKQCRAMHSCVPDFRARGFSAARSSYPASLDGSQTTGADGKEQRNRTKCQLRPLIADKLISTDAKLKVKRYGIRFALGNEHCHLSPQKASATDARLGVPWTHPPVHTRRANRISSCKYSLVRDGQWCGAQPTGSVDSASAPLIFDIAPTEPLSSPNMISSKTKKRTLLDD